jgi:Caspase domain
VLMTQAPEKQLVIAIGNDLGLDGDEPLVFAQADAVRVSEVFAEVGLPGAVPPVVLRGATRDEVLATLEALRRAASPLGSLVVYYAGHGDAQTLHLAGARLPISDLLAAVERIPAALKVVIVDACRVGARARGVTVGPPFDVRAERSRVTGTVVISAAGDGEPAYESSSLKGAIFTHFLLSGLRGAADLNGDGRVTVDEVFEHAWSRTVRQSALADGAMQRPELLVETRGEGSAFLTQPARADAQVIIEPGDAQYVFFRSQGAPMGEVTASARRLTLALPRGRYTVLRRRPDEGAAVADLDLAWGGTASVGVLTFKRVEEQWLSRRGPEQRHASWLLAAAAVVTAPLMAAPGVGGELRLGYRRGIVTASLGVGATRRALTLASTSGTETRFTLRPTVGVRWENDWFELEGYLGATIVPTWQSLERLDATRATEAGLPSRFVLSGLVGGPLVGARAGWRLARWFEVLVDGSSALEFWRDSRGEARSTVQLSLSLGGAIAF